jgi:hypothetical protein
MRIADLLDLEKEVTDAQAPAPPAPPAPPASAPGLQGPVSEAAVDPIARIVAERPRAPEPTSDATSPPPRPVPFPWFAFVAGAVVLVLLLRTTRKTSTASQTQRQVAHVEGGLVVGNAEVTDYGAVPDLYERLTEPFLWA